MVSPDFEAAVRTLNDIDSLIAFLRSELQWPIPDDATIEDMSFDWTDAELKLGDATKQRLRSGTVYQLRPMAASQPWGIFLIEFADDRVYKTALKEVLRGLVPKRRASGELPTWNHDNILFICLSADQQFTFAHFRGRDVNRAHLVRFSWSPHEPIRTLCEFSLPALRMPESDLVGIDPQLWVEQWSKAFDVEKITRQFFTDYYDVADRLQELLYQQEKDKEWAHDCALQLLNRVTFLYFVQKKGWLGGDRRFIKTLWDTYKKSGSPRDTFYSEWLSVLFFEAFNNQFQSRAEYRERFPDDVLKAFAEAPYLNGGLFTHNNLDDRMFAIGDTYFERLFDKHGDSAPGFFERYNFTITEDSPLDREVAVDPEMLGTVYEGLVNVTFEGVAEEDRRGLAGMFYTPRIEIDLMCRLALADWLYEQLSDGHRDGIRNAVFAYSREEKVAADTGLSEANLWDALDRTLRSVTIVDPACGSGSFLIGMLLIIDDLLARAGRILGTEKRPYERRKEIIENSLYGVDVMDWAVHVAELRLWLQLTIETELSKPELKLEPLLPNLSFKVRAGDSLVQEIEGVNFGLHEPYRQFSSPLKGKLTSLKGAKKTYFQGRAIGDRQKQALQEQELQLFREIVIERVQECQRQIGIRRANLDAADSEQLDLVGGSKSKQYAMKVDLLRGEMGAFEHELERLSRALDALKDKSATPFVWDIDFVEVFTSERGGFDIVIGNPPYVRQESIADPRERSEDFGGEASDKWRNRKAAYKAKLQRSVYEAWPDFFGYNPARGTVSRKIDGKCDLYIFFFLHGLKLLNRQGRFCFITSNSWLDVAYGTQLQELLLRYSNIRYIIDNEAKRSFEHADVNTVISLFTAPALKDDSGFPHQSRFVMFRRPFEDALSQEAIRVIDSAMGRVRTDDFRVVVNRQRDLYAAGSISSDGTAESPAVLARREYAGDKWGGKYLRSPDIFWRLLNKASSRFIRLGDIVTIRRGFTTGANQFFYLNPSSVRTWSIEDRFLRPVVKSPKEVVSIYVDPRQLQTRVFVCHEPKARLKGTHALKYIEWGEQQHTKGRQKQAAGVPLPQTPSLTSRELWYALPDRKAGDFFCNRFFGDRFFFAYSDDVIEDQTFYAATFAVTPPSRELAMAVLNSTVTILMAALLGRVGLGEGVLQYAVYEMENLLVPNPLVIPPKFGSRIVEAFEDMRLRRIEPIVEDLKMTDRQYIDRAIFECFGMDPMEIEELYSAVAQNVQSRLSKAVIT